MMRKKNNMRRGGGHGHGGHGRRYHNNSGGGNRGNDGQNIQRQKHHATQMREKYTNMARDAQNNGDRVDVEYYMQHVDHYTRVLTDIAAIEAERFAAQREQQAAQNPEGGDQPADSNGNGGDAGNGGGDSEPPVQMGGNQPRMTRGPRHHQQNQPRDAQSSENQAGGDIPLPGSVLSAI